MGLLCLLLAFVQPIGASADTRNPIDLVLDATEAEAVLLVLDKSAAGQPVTEADWRRISSSTGRSTSSTYRGPWYTVGYRMGAVVENRYGRPALLECMADPRLLLKRYNQAAAEQNAAGNEKRSLWSAEVLSAVGIQ